MTVLIEKLKSKKIIISGANGFTGRYLCRDLSSKGIHFSVILRPEPKLIG